MSEIEKKLNELNITLPEPSSPAANYVPYVISGSHVFISGQIPLENGSFEHNSGKLGEDLKVEEGIRIARVCAINILAQIKHACGGDLEKIKRCVKLGVFVNSTGDFTDQPAVANGASDLIVDVLGDRGKHARFAVGAPSLPRGVAVEIDAVFEI